MGLCKTSNIFTFINSNDLNSNDLKFCTCSYSSCVYHMIRFTGSNGKVCKMMMSHFRTIRILHTVRGVEKYLKLWMTF